MIWTLKGTLVQVWMFKLHLWDGRLRWGGGARRRGGLWFNASKARVSGDGSTGTNVGLVRGWGVEGLEVEGANGGRGWSWSRTANREAFRAFLSALGQKITHLPPFTTPKTCWSGAKEAWRGGAGGGTCTLLFIWAAMMKRAAAFHPD